MPDEAQTPEAGVQDPPSSTTTVTPPELTGPWANDIAQRFDPSVQGDVAAFLAESVQPYVTRLEQDTKPAKQLYTDLLETPADTFLAIAEELWGEDAAKNIEEQLTQQFNAQQEENNVPDETPPAAPQLTPEQQAAIDWANQQAQKQVYDSEFERVKGAHPDVPEEQWNLIHPFVAAADGDWEKAYAGFEGWLGEAKSVFGTAEADPPAETAPAALGGDTQTPPAPPVAKDYSGPNGLDDAISDFLAETRAQAPPVVGSA